MRDVLSRRTAMGLVATRLANLGAGALLPAPARSAVDSVTIAVQHGVGHPPVSEGAGS